MDRRHCRQGRLHSAKAKALEGDKRAASVESEERLPFDDRVVPKSARQYTKKTTDASAIGNDKQDRHARGKLAATAWLF